jgi:RNA polymerase sigma-70 factor, ECF subfamily
VHQESLPWRYLGDELRPQLTTRTAASLAAIATQFADHELVTAAQGGDRGALDQLLRRHYDRVHAVCRRITGHEADAADAAQDAMIAIVRNLDRFDGRSSFGTWAYRIATNASLDELRRRKRRAVPMSNDDDDEHGYHDVADPDSARRVDAIGDHMALDAALRTLSDDYRLPVVLRDVADLDYAEIAAVLGIPAGTVKSRIARGRAALAKALSPQTGNQGSGNQRTDPERPSRAP